MQQGVGVGHFVQQADAVAAFILLVLALMSVGSWYFFHEGLGVILPAGILDGVL